MSDQDRGRAEAGGEGEVVRGRGGEGAMLQGSEGGERSRSGGAEAAGEGEVVRERGGEGAVVHMSGVGLITNQPARRQFGSKHKSQSYKRR